MALRYPVGFDKNYLREKVLNTYIRVASEPDGDFHFHRRENYAIEYLGCDRQELSFIPEESKKRFAGVGNPYRINIIKGGQIIFSTIHA